MTAHQRRPGFRLPWATESDRPSAAEAAPGGAPEPAAAQPVAPGGDEARAVPDEPATKAAPASSADPASAEPAPPSDVAARPSEPPATAEGEPPPADFMRELVGAMRRVAEEARRSTIAELQARAEERVRAAESEAEARRAALRSRAETDIAAVGDWARAEAERIKAEAEQRVAARRAHLEQELVADTIRAETEAGAIRRRVAEFEQELQAFHERLAGISDPAAFASAAKQMPRPPSLDGESAEAGTVAVATGAVADVEAPPEGAVPVVAQADDASTTEVVVKGLGSFGAITGFRQSLSNVQGIEAVALSLGPTGEFVFRATHAPGFDVGAAVAVLEGDGASVERRAEGGLRVTLSRPR